MRRLVNRCRAHAGAKAASLGDERVNFQLKSLAGFAPFRNWPAPLKLIIASVLAWGLGLCWSSLRGDDTEYLDSLGFVLGSVGIPLIFVTVAQLASGVEQHFGTALKYFDGGDALTISVNSLVRDSIRMRYRLVLSSLIAVLIVSFTVIAFFCPAISATPSGLQSLRPPVMSAAIFRPSNAWAGFWTVLPFCLAASYALGTAIVLQIAYSRGLRALNLGDPVPSPQLLRIALRPLGGVAVVSAVSWAVGLLIFTIPFLSRPDAFSIAFSGILTALWLCFFFYAMTVLQQVVVRAQLIGVDRITEEYRSAVNSGRTGWSLSVPSLPDYLKMERYSIFGWGGVVVVTLSTIVSVGSFIIQLLKF